MSDEQDRAEDLDGDVLGEDAASDEYPDLDQEGEIGPMSAEDPNVLQGDADTPDDERTRTWRERSEVGESDVGTEDGERFELIDPDDTLDVPTLDQQGVEHELTADAVAADDGPLDPEDAALHIERD